MSAGKPGMAQTAIALEVPIPFLCSEFQSVDPETNLCFRSCISSKTHWTCSTFSLFSAGTSFSYVQDVWLEIWLRRTCAFSLKPCKPPSKKENSPQNLNIYRREFRIIKFNNFFLLIKKVFGSQHGSEHPQFPPRSGTANPQPHSCCEPHCHKLLLFTPQTTAKSQRKAFPFSPQVPNWPAGITRQWWITNQLKPAISWAMQLPIASHNIEQGWPTQVKESWRVCWFLLLLCT